MAYTASKPLDTQTIAAAPADIRDNFEGLRTGRIVDAGTVNGLTTGNATGNIPVANGTVCTNLNAEKVGGNLPSAFATAGHPHAVATTSSNGFMANTDKAKLDGIASGAQVNQVAFSNVLVGSTTIQADSATDTLTIIAGTNIVLTPDATNDAVTIGITGTVASATTATNATTHISNATGAHAASAISNAASGNIAATTVQAAINELDTEKAPIAHATTATTYGVSSATNYGHSIASSATPLVAGTATVGTNNGKFAREGHVHPLQTSVTGNAGTATKLATARTIAGVTFDGTENIAIPYSGLTGVPSDSAYDAAHSFTTNGYQKLSNGFIFQWGKITTTYSASVEIPFTIAFPNACFWIESELVINSDINPRTPREWSKTGFKYVYQDNSATSSTNPVKWMAIGY